MAPGQSILLNRTESVEGESSGKRVEVKSKDAVGNVRSVSANRTDHVGCQFADAQLFYYNTAVIPVLVWLLPLPLQGRIQYRAIGKQLRTGQSLPYWTIS